MTGWPGKWPWKIRLVDRDRFHADAFRFALETEDAIDHQERITMRQNAPSPR